MTPHLSKLNIERPGLIITGVTFAALAVLFAVLAGSQMVPALYLVIYAAVGMLLADTVFVLTKRRTKKARFAFGTVLAVLVLFLCAAAGVYLHRTVQTLQSVSDTAIRRSTINFYVSVDSPAQTLQDAADYTFGILAEDDRRNTDAILAQVAEQEGLEIKTVECTSLIYMADAFHNGEIDGLLLNSAYMDLYADTPGYETFADELKIISAQTVERTVTPETAAKEDNIINILISGSDTRSVTIDESGRSDVNIIVSINTDTRDLLMLSTPRDYFVALDIEQADAYDKLTHAGVYGMDVLTGTLGRLYGIDIDYFFRLNFTGFVKIIDALGGVDVRSSYEFDSGGYHYAEGINHLDGEAALEFAHNRYAFSEGDRQRGNNQRAVLRAALDKAMSPAILSNYLSILESVQDCVYTNMPDDVLADLVRQQLDDPQEWHISSFSVNGSDATSTTYSIDRSLYVMIPDMLTVHQAQRLLEDVGNDVGESVGAYAPDDGGTDENES